MKFMEIDGNILISAMMNLDKFLLKNPKFIINKYNCYKIFFSSLLETNKLYDDFNIPNNFLYKVGLLKGNELKSLELEFLERIDFNIFIEENNFFEYRKKLENLFKLRIDINKKKNLKENNLKIKGDNNDNNDKENNKIFEDNKNINDDIREKSYLYMN